MSAGAEIENLGSFELKISGILILCSIGPIGLIGTDVDLRSTLLTLGNAQTSLALLSLNRNVNLLTVNRAFFSSAKVLLVGYRLGKSGKAERMVWLLN